MITTIIVGVIGLAGGFGLGRVKNKAKLAAAQAELDSLKAKVAPAVATVVADAAAIKSKI